MSVIFSSFGCASKVFAKLLVRFGVDVFYIDSECVDRGSINYEKLMDCGILPLPMEDLEKVNNLVECDDGVGDKTDAVISAYVSKKMLDSQCGLYHGINEVSKKLKISVRSSLKVSYVCRANIWSKSRIKENHILIVYSLKELFSIPSYKNVFLVYVPVDFFYGFFRVVKKIILKLFHTNSKIVKNNKGYGEFLNCHVAYVVHKGLSYGKVFDKSHVYSNIIGSPFHEENLLHLNYSGGTYVESGRLWSNLSVREGRLKSAFSPLVKGWRNVRGLKSALSMLALIKIYVDYRGYFQSLNQYPSLHIAIIDYEVLCPKSLLLAFESRAIRTVAIQERFIMSFYNSYGVFLDHYFVSSEYVRDIMKESSAYEIKKYSVVGQYRCDKFFQSYQDKPNEILELYEEDTKIVVALGYHVSSYEHHSKSNPLLNWKAQLAFLEDMIKLAVEIDNIYVVIRYKDIEWVEVNQIRHVIDKISLLDNVVLSTEYDEGYYSYKLCSYADLVVAKHTSLGDECLACGIPVLFYEYQHNVKGIVSPVFDYFDSGVMCYDYEDMEKKVFDVLYGRDNLVDYSSVCNELYGNYCDGESLKRIHENFKDIYSDEFEG